MAESAHPSLPSLWRKRQRQLPCQLDSPLLVAVLQEVWRHEEKINSQLLLYIRCLLRNFAYTRNTVTWNWAWSCVGTRWTGKAHETAVDTAHRSLPVWQLLARSSADGWRVVGSRTHCTWHMAPGLAGCPCAAVGQVRHPGSLWGEISCESLVVGEGALDSGMRSLCPRQGGMQSQTHSKSSRYQRKKTCWQGTNFLLWLFSCCIVKPYITLIRINLSENKGFCYFR